MLTGKQSQTKQILFNITTGRDSEAVYTFLYIKILQGKDSGLCLGNPLSATAVFRILLENMH